ncbi:MAG: MBL fold metallo-hydrolase [Longimicrobiales bacterium]
MILRRFYNDNLAQASYLVGCSVTGEALVVDPNRDAAEYVAAAAREGLRVTHVTETHIHADFVSGLRELCALSGATAYVSRMGGTDWQYAFAASDGAMLLSDHDVFMVGNIRIEALHTPGHTPEHLTFMVTDTAGADRPMGAFTGDFIFAGDVGRPDLLEKAAGLSGTMEAGARQLFASLQHFKEYPDYLQIWPGHGAGSACGKALGAVPQTTLGYERLFNWGLAEQAESAFVTEILSGQPTPPPYFAQMKNVNRAGPVVLGAPPSASMSDMKTLLATLDRGALAVDTRTWKEFAAEHVRGSINIALNKSFPTWAGSFIPYGQPFHLIAADAASAERAVRELSLIGLDDVAGVTLSEGLAAAREAGNTQASDETGVAELQQSLGDARTTVLDVRNPGEWLGGHVPADAPGTSGGAKVLHIPIEQLVARIAEVPRDERIMVHCKSGARSAIATSILELHGIHAHNVRGGFDAWRAAGLPVSAAESGDKA